MRQLAMDVFRAAAGEQLTGYGAMDVMRKLDLP
jgi:signal recognition particle GTPase